MSEPRYECDRCGKTFTALDPAKHHAVVEERRPVNPMEVINRV